jgi:hypothetical protein
MTRTDALLGGLREVCMMHGASQEILTELSRQVHSYLDQLPSEKDWLAHAKHMLAYYLAKYLKNEPPPAVAKIFRPTGKLHQWMRCRLWRFSSKNSHFWYSWYQSKRAALPVSKEIVESAYQKHWEILSKSDSGCDETIKEIMSQRSFKVITHIRREFTKRYMAMSEEETFRASSSACFEAKRSEGGQFGYLCSLAGFDLMTCFGSSLDSMRDDNVFGIVRKLLVSEIRLPNGRDEWSVLQYHLQERSPEKCKATICAVLEPFKIRLISKGEALPYYGCKKMQIALHSTLREMDCFRLIGRPFSVTDLYDLREKSTPTDEWFSIDYSAATDDLSWKYSGQIFNSLIRDLPRDIKRRGNDVLGPHQLYYPTKFGPIYYGDQANGQLMGSVLSFPILCLANLGLYLKVTEYAHSGWTLPQRLRHVLINGDDMLYTADSSLWQRHVDIGEEIGLRMSIGKAYHHSVYANINSTSIHWDLSRQDLSPLQIGFFNSGLFLGRHKVQAKSDDDVKNSFVSSLPKVLEGCLESSKCSITARYLVMHKLILKKECEIIQVKRGRRSSYTRNLFIPISRGGMGITAPNDFKFKVKPFDRLLAKRIRNSCCALGTSQKPLPGYELTKLETELVVPWIKPLFSVWEPMEIGPFRKDLMQIKNVKADSILYSLFKGGVVA